MQMSKEECRCLDVEESGCPHGLSLDLWFSTARKVQSTMRLQIQWVHYFIVKYMLTNPDTEILAMHTHI